MYMHPHIHRSTGLNTFCCNILYYKCNEVAKHLINTTDNKTGLNTFCCNILYLAHSKGRQTLKRPYKCNEVPKHLILQH